MAWWRHRQRDPDWARTTCNIAEFLVFADRFDWLYDLETGRFYTHTDKVPARLLGAVS